MCQIRSRQALVPIPAPTPDQIIQARSYADDSEGFQAAVTQLGTRIVINFDDVDANPINNTIEGRAPFDGRRYSDQGITLSNPNNIPLYIAPGGLFWNPSNSLSVGRLPFDPFPGDEDDDLDVTLQQACGAVAFSVIDNPRPTPGEVIQFFDSEGRVIHEVPFPGSFIGIVSPERPVAKISISEALGDGDDVTYDDFVCIRSMS